MTRQDRSIAHDDAIAELAVVCNVGRRHEQAFIADARLHDAALRAAMNRHRLSDNGTIADAHARRLTAILEILRWRPDRGEGKHLTALAELGVALEVDVGVQDSTPLDPDSTLDDAIRPD